MTHRFTPRAASPHTSTPNRHTWRTCVAATLLAVGCSQTPPAPREVSVPAAPEAASNDPSDAEPEPYSRFLTRFLAALENSGESPEALNSFVDPAHGVFLLINPGAFTIVESYRSYGELARTPHLGGSLLHSKMGCDAELHSLSARLPQFSCDDERYDVPHSCYQGEFKSGVLRQHLVWMQEYLPAETPEAGREFTQLMAKVEGSEQLVTHYFFSTRVSRGYFFGQVGGAWRLIWVNAVSPCSA